MLTISRADFTDPSLPNFRQAYLADMEPTAPPRISLETGSMEFFAPARVLYAKHGFVECRPFGRYVEDPNSTFMTLTL